MNIKRIDLNLVKNVSFSGHKKKQDATGCTRHNFYYLYDSENDYYFYRPASPSYFKVKEITSTKANGNDYSINCFIAEDLADASVEAEDIALSITTMPNNNWIKYRVNKIEISK